LGEPSAGSSWIQELTESGRLAPELAARFEAGEAIVLPGLGERPEDLRSIVADRLAREGLRVRGRPIGIDAAAFSRLVEYPFEGEDAELASIVTKLVARVLPAGRDVVTAADVDALGIRPQGGPKNDDLALASLPDVAEGHVDDDAGIEHRVEDAADLSRGVITRDGFRTRR